MNSIVQIRNTEDTRFIVRAEVQSLQPPFLKQEVFVFLDTGADSTAIAKNVLQKIKAQQLKDPSYSVRYTNGVVTKTTMYKVKITLKPLLKQFLIKPEPLPFNHIIFHKVRVTSNFQQEKTSLLLKESKITISGLVGQDMLRHGVLVMAGFHHSFHCHNVKKYVH